MVVSYTISGKSDFTHTWWSQWNTFGTIRGYTFCLRRVYSRLVLPEWRQTRDWGQRETRALDILTCRHHVHFVSGWAAVLVDNENRYLADIQPSIRSIR